MDKELYPGDVDFDYKIRCDKHQFKPYVYCEMCMVRTQLQDYVTESKKYVHTLLSSAHLAISVLNDVGEKHRKQIEELEIRLKLLKEVNLVKQQKDINDLYDRLLGENHE